MRKGKHYPKLSEALSGEKHPFYGKKRLEHSKKMIGKGNPFYGKKHTEESKQRMRMKKLGKKHTKESIELMRKVHRGKRFSDEHKRKLGEAHKGEKCHFWKGGIAYLPYPVDWTQTLRRSIRERDNYICQVCSQYGDIVHHIDYDKKNCNPDNLITLCDKCHGKTQHNREYWEQYFSRE